MSLYEEIKTSLEQAIEGEGEILLSPEQRRNKALIDRYPFLLPRNVWTDKVDEDYDYTYIRGIGEIPEGWNKLFLQMCEDIRQPLIDAGYLDKFRFSQIKEKWGYLDCYHFGAPKTVINIMDKYSVMASYVCTRCGQPATYETQGWVASYCDDCLKYFGIHERITRIKFKPYQIVRCWEPDSGEHEKTISFEDEWNRYLNNWKS